MSNAICLLQLRLLEIYFNSVRKKIVSMPVELQGSVCHAEVFEDNALCAAGLLIFYAFILLIYSQ